VPLHHQCDLPSSYRGYQSESCSDDRHLRPRAVDRHLFARWRTLPSFPLCKLSIGRVMPSPATATKPNDWRTTDPGVVDRLLRGSIDLHCHSGPSFMRRYLDHYEALQEAASMGLRALLLKDHCYP